MVSNNDRNDLNEWECQVCVEIIDAEDINAAWLLQYDFIVCEKCVVEHNMTVKGESVEQVHHLTPDVSKDLDLEDLIPSRVRAMADINGEI